MTVEYRDETPFTNDLHTLQQIADALRHKKFGKDVREAIAQAVEKLYGIGPNTVVSGSPAGAYATLSELQSAYPNGQQGVFVVAETGKWYIWNPRENRWEEGGSFQSPMSQNEIEDGRKWADGTVSPKIGDAIRGQIAQEKSERMRTDLQEKTERQEADRALNERIDLRDTALEVKNVRLKDSNGNLLWNGDKYVTGRVYLPKTDKTGLEEGLPVDSSIIGYTFLGHLKEYGLPILRLEHPNLLDLKTKADGKVKGVKFEYTPNGGPGKYLQGTLDSIKVQGSGAQRYVKKNYTLKFTEDIQFKSEWGKHDKYVIKADWVDFSHMRNEFGASLWGDIRKTRIETNNNILVDNNGNELVRTEISNLTGEIRQQFAMGINLGAIDSYPIFVVVNDIYHGLYSFNVPKDDWMAGMGKGNREAIVSSTQYASTRFKAHVNVDSKGNLNDGGFEVEYVSDEDNQTWVPTSLNKVIDAVQSNTDVDKYLDVDSVVDYLLINLLDANQDAVDRNWLMDTWDGTRWTFVAYDMDSAFGNYWDGAHYDSPSAYDLNYHTNISNLYKWIVENRKEDLLDRWDYLRKGELSDNTLLNKVYNFAIKTPEEAFAYERKRWPGRPGTRTNNYQQIVTWLLMRTKFLDEMFDKIR